MVTSDEYAQLSARVYAATDVNRIGIPLGRSQLQYIPDGTLTGFSAGVFRPA